MNYLKTSAEPRVRMVAYDKGSTEESWDYLKRKCPDIHDALYSIDRLSAVRKALFDGTFYWGDSEEARITEKAIDGCLQMEIQDLQNQLFRINDWKDEIEEKHKVITEKEKKWHVFARERDEVVFENEVGDLEKMPRDLLNIISGDQSFDGEIQSEGAFVKFVREGKTICKVSKSLVDQLRTGESTPKGGRG